MGCLRRKRRAAVFIRVLEEEEKGSFLFSRASEEEEVAVFSRVLEEEEEGGCIQQGVRGGRGGWLHIQQGVRGGREGWLYIQ